MSFRNTILVSWPQTHLALFLISPSFGASVGLCFVIVAFPGYLHLYFGSMTEKSDHRRIGRRQPSETDSEGSRALA